MNVKLILINKIINKIITKISYRFSLFLFISIQRKWINIINISLINNVENSILDYFFELYNIYLKKEIKIIIINIKLYIIQAKNILGINIKK